MPPSPSLAGLPAIDGDIADDEANTAPAAQDWGRLVQARPRAIVRPASPADVATVLRFASRHDIPVAARGAGHSPFGQSQTEGGIVLDMTGLARVRPSTGAELVVEAGARWRRVLAAALTRGLTPPVLPDYLGLTVGGTLTVGGVGGASHRHGAQTDTVTALEVVTGDGEIVRCSAEQRGDLFDAARAGLGQCGVITTATIRLHPARQRARRRKLYYRDLAAFLADQRTVVTEDRFDHVEGSSVLGDGGEWWHVLKATTYFSLPDSPDDQRLCDGLSFDPELTEIEESAYPEFLDRMADDVAAMRANGSWFRPHPWLTLFVGDDEVEDVVGDTLADTTRSDLGASGLVLLYPLRTDRLATPLLRVPSASLVWLFALLRTGDPYDPVGTARMVERNILLYERVHAGGGTSYPVNALPMSPKDWKSHYGEKWDAFSSARRRFDPSGVLTPGQHVFTSP